MTYSKTAIANMSLGHLGIGKEIANLDTENSQEARSCRRFYDVTREAALRDAKWPFATVRRTLALIAEDPNDEWAFVYRYPTNCLLARRIVSGIRVDTQESRIPHKVEQDSAGIVIYTDQADAILEYTVQETDTTRFPPDFVMALSLRLAAYIAPSLTSGDPTGLGVRATQMYMIEIARVDASAFNEDRPDLPPDSEFIRERE